MRAAGVWRRSFVQAVSARHANYHFCRTFGGNPRSNLPFLLPPPLPRACSRVRVYAFVGMYRDGLLRWALGCVNHASWLSLATGCEFTQPWAHLIANLCTSLAFLRHWQFDEIFRSSSAPLPVSLPPSPGPSYDLSHPTAF